MARIDRGFHLHSIALFVALKHPDQYRTVRMESLGDFRDRGSKFPSYLFHCLSMDQLSERIAQLKKEHSSARHFCYAVIFGEERFMRANDDGEPSGTAGLPIQNQLQSAELEDVALVVVRYFGGTKLGKSGLISAYKESAKDAIEKAKIIELYRERTVQVEFGYDQTGSVMNAIDRIEGASIIDQSYSDLCKTTFTVPRSSLEQALTLFDHTDAVNIRPFEPDNSK